MKSDKEVRLARWFNSHHQVLTTTDARTLGITKDDLQGLARQGRIRHPHVGVWVQVHHREHPALIASAAALATGGPRSALSHGSAAWLWQMAEAPPATVHLLVPHGSHRQIAGVHLHRARRPIEVRTQQGLRITDPLRTLVDLADRAPGLLAAALDRTLMLKIVRFSDLACATDPATGTHRPGVVSLRAQLERLGYLGAPEPSVLESQMTRLIARSGLPSPIAEYVAGADGEYRLDFAYPNRKLAIEVEGYAWHHDPAKVAADHARRNELQRQGWTVLVFTWTHIRDDPEQVISDIVNAYHELAA